jgi:uncharacterized protein (TIRG00374 family)
MKRYVIGLLLSVLVAMVLYGAGILLGGAGETRARMAEISLATWLVIIALSLGNYGLRFLRWHLYIARLSGRRIAPSQHGLIYLAGFALTTTPGKAGEVLRSTYLVDDGVPYTDSIGAWFVERVVDLITIFLLALLAVTFFSNPAVNAVALAVGAVIVLMLPLLHSPLPDAVLSTLSRGVPRFGAAAAKLRRFLSQSALLLRSRFLLGGLAIGLVAWFLEGVGLYLVLRELSVDVGLLLAVGIYGVGVLLGALSFIPGGLGSTEAAMLLLLQSVGADPAAAVAATLICRIVTLWLAVFLGVLAALLLGGMGRLPRFGVAGARGAAP